MPNAAPPLTPQQTRRDYRPNAASRGYDARWQAARLAFLRKHPLCVLCERDEPASVVDHITPHRGNAAIFWDVTNWQPLCKRCHDRKTGKGG